MARISFEGQVVVLTGAAGSLGRAYARELARRGASLVVNDLTGADQLAAEIESEGGRAVASTESVATPEGGRGIIETALAHFGAVDAVIHNAGAWRHHFYDEMVQEHLDPVLDVHLRGAFFVTQPAWELMKQKGYGRIVLTSSGAGAFGREKGSNYVAAKAGVIGLGRALAIEGASHGITCNCILPIAPFNRQRPGPPEVVDSLLRAGLPPNADPELVAPMVAYLASPACQVNGEAFSAGCGRFARVFTGVTPGWLTGPDETATAEDIEAHLGEIEDPGGFTIPASVWDELRELGEAYRRRTRPEP